MIVFQSTRKPQNYESLVARMDTNIFIRENPCSSMVQSCTLIVPMKQNKNLQCTNYDHRARIDCDNENLNSIDYISSLRKCYDRSCNK
ncbi:hypothetical protein Pan54_05520 [Rubinisphaera italica]|uniref:Uncharacterized protein n=1 Tax=Rubinisphaera italica TaxID=2527969 RepID=A0A5C5XBP5_9PLAN|nr:hypothetical protein Pan54_05520 [Rubinisphaera italica]